MKGLTTPALMNVPTKNTCRKGWRGILQLCLTMLVLFNGELMAQVPNGSLPVSFSAAMKFKPSIGTTVLQRFDPAKLRAMDVAEGVQNRYGLLEKQTIDLREVGTYSQRDGMNVWQYRFESEDALSLAVQLSTFDVPEGAALYVYNADRSVVRGGFSSQNRKVSGGLMLSEITGGTVILEYNEPVDADFQGGVVVGGLVKAYAETKSTAASRLQINCPEGDNWQTEKRAVCMITFNDSKYAYYCSGALMNNVREDGTAYFLTANHCVATSAEAATLVAYFNYENSGCSTTDASLSQSVSGAVLRATSAYSDFTLLELDEYPPYEYQPYFLGWNNSGETPTSGTAIHHPDGTAKCIAIDDDLLTSNKTQILWDDGTTSRVGTHWQTSYDSGGDEGGSSGCPLMDADKLVVGQLHGGDDDISLFGKLSVSWAYRSESNRQLKVWLDPDNTGTTRMKGLNGYSKPVADFSVSDTIACLGESVKLTDASRYTPDSWTWTITPATYEFTGGSTASSESPEILFLNEGIYTVQLKVENENGSDLETTIVEVYGSLPVRLLDFADEVTMCGWEFDSLMVWSEGASAFSWGLTADEKFVKTAAGASLQLSLTDVAKTEGSFDTYLRVTGTHGSCSSSDSVLIHVIIPDNDNVAQATALRLGANGYFSNDCATVEENEPAPATAGCSVVNNWCPPNSDTVLDNSVWFTFEAPSSGRVTVETKGLDTQMAIYRAVTADYILSGSSNSYQMVAASDNASDGSSSAVLENVELMAGHQYWLQVDGTNGAEGEFELNLRTNSIEVYPNPSTGVFHLTVASMEDGDATLAVYGQHGELVYQGNGSFTQSNNTIDFDLSGKPSGVYYFRAVINGQAMTRKLVLIGGQ